MISRKNESLKDKTSFHVGGIAQNYWIPESIDELKNIAVNLKGQPVWVISGGSNLLINDEKVFENVISMKEADKTFENIGDGRFYIGASNRIQKVISYVNESGYGGFEELIGLPALFGGIVYMNAGIGGRNKERFSIADFIVRVKVLDRSTFSILWIDQKDCGFGYRKSIFQDDDYIIVGAEIQLYEQKIENSNRRISQRREYIRNNQEFGKGCFGSCFSMYRPQLLEIASMIPQGVWGGLRLSSNNKNWLINNGECTFKDAVRYVNFCKLLHKITFSKVELEVKLWK